MRFFTSMGFSMTSKPATLAVPSVGGKKHVKTRMVVVLPAPFGPRKPTICPFSTSKEMLSTATVRAYRLVRPSTLIIGCVPEKNGRRTSAMELHVKFHHTDGCRDLSNEAGAAVR